MGRNNKFPDNSWNDLLSRYEAMKASGEFGYLDPEEIADLANHYLNSINMEEASAVIEYGLKLHPNNPVIRIEQGFYYLDMDEPEKAREVIKDISDDWSEEVIFLKVEISLMEKNIEEAKRLFETLNYTDDQELIIRIAYVWLDLGFPEEALAFMERFRKKLQDEEEFIEIYAEACLQMHKPKEALKYYNQLLDRQPYSANYWVALARCYYELRQYGKCIEACDFALAADEEFTVAHLFKGDALFMLDEDKEAIDEYRKSITFQAIPQPMNTLFLALKYFSQEKYEESVPYFEEALQAMSGEEVQMRLNVYNYLPSALLILGRIEEARRYTDEWIQYAPGDPYAHLMSCRVCVTENNLSRMEQAAREAIRHTEETEVLDDTGQLCVQAGLYYTAKEAFEKLKSIDSTFKNIDIELLNIYLHLNEDEKIVSALKRINSDIWTSDLESYWKGSTYEEKKTFIEALMRQIDELKNSKENNPDQQ